MPSGATSVTFLTNGTAALNSGTYQITATQTLTGQTVSVGNLSTTTDLGPSAASPATSLTINTAPVLTPETPTLTTIHLNTPGTFALSNFIINGSGTHDQTTGITDADATNPVGGIAVTKIAGAGTWEYSLDGSTYEDIGAVTAASALLLPSTAYVRYIPDGKTVEPVGTATITYCAWDATSGASGTKVNTTTNGGTTAFSTATDTASPNVVGITDNVVLTPAHPSMGKTYYQMPDTIGLSSFINAKSGISTTIALAASDTNGVAGGIAVTGTTGNGTWSYSLGGPTCIPLGTVALNAALLLPADASLIYTPTISDTTAPTITYYAWDATDGKTAGSTVDLSTTTLGGASAYSLFSDTASLTVLIPPVLTAANPSLGITDLATAKTVSLSTFINNGEGTTKITDAMPGAAIGGIAVTATSGKGTWSYSLDDGTTFNPIGTVTPTSALPLPSTAELRYTPDGVDAETATITYVAWDTTIGTAGTPLDTIEEDNIAAFSAASDTASLKAADASLSGYVFFDSNGSGKYLDSQGNAQPGFGGVTLKLLSQDSSGDGTEVSTIPPVQTAADGSYSFPSVPAGNYQIEIVPPTEVAMGTITPGEIAGAAKGTVGANLIAVSVAAGQSGANYNFAIVGVLDSFFSLRAILSSTPPLPEYVSAMRAAPTVNLNGTSGGPGHAATYTPSTTSTPASLPIADSAATISGVDSPTLVSMTIAIQSPPDGSSEQLKAGGAATGVTPSFANGVLTLSGAADIAAYQTLLESVVYSDDASSPTAGVREVSVVVNDGVSASDAVFAAITVDY